MSTSRDYLADSVILTSTLFGSIYLFSSSLFGLNQKWLKDAENSNPWGRFEIMNFSIMGISGIVIGFTASKAYEILAAKTP
jgi:cellobiose-specific phosphotransferase system component IIC